MHARHSQEIAAFALVTSKTLVNRRSNIVVNIASTKMMKKIFRGVLPRQYRVPAITSDGHASEDGGVAPRCSPSLREARATKQSSFLLAAFGLLRGACHRARNCATRWLAMTGEYAVAARTARLREPRSDAGNKSAHRRKNSSSFSLTRYLPLCSSRRLPTFSM